MNKELSPLEALEKLVDRLAIKKYDENGNLIYWESTTDKEYNIIETALKRLEKIETTTHSVLREDISNKLKAFEIIKSKKVNVRCLMSGWNLGKYNSYKSHIKLTEEEYELLKEVFL